ncbi:MAG: hypothetical protein FWE54_07370, partial [Methanimicrococcus sp.]|nr:hypothetical protein [Methanimicrococcus sp.]
INNKAEIYINDKKVDEDDDDTDEGISGFAKNSQAPYVPGGVLVYDIEFTLPSDLTNITNITVIDNYGASGFLTYTAGSYTLTVDPSVDLSGVLIESLGTGTVTFKIDVANSTLAGDEKITFTLEFDVSGTASGPINNKAEIYINDDFVEEVENETDEGVSGFTKNSLAPYVPGGVLTYEIEFTLPSDLTNVSNITVIDTYGDSGFLTYVAGNYTLTVDSLVDLSGVLTETTGTGTVTFIIDVNNSTLTGGETITIALDFDVSATAAGNINNKAEIKINDKKVDEDDDDTDEGVSGFAKNSHARYVPGGVLVYDIEFTLPSDLTNITNITVIDNFSNSGFLTYTGYTVTVGPLVDISGVLTETLGTGIVTFEIDVAGSTLAGGEKITLTLEFDVSGSATGAIYNKAEIYINDEKVDEAENVTNEVTRDSSGPGFSGGNSTQSNPPNNYVPEQNMSVVESLPGEEPQPVTQFIILLFPIAVAIFLFAWRRRDVAAEK